MNDERVFAARTTESEGLLLAHPAKVRGLSYVGTTTPGLIRLRDGGGGDAATVLELDTPATAFAVQVCVPGHLEFEAGVHVGLQNVGALTLFWSDV